jgi:hypothetical protein
MNLSQVAKLKNGDKVKLVSMPFALTLGKSYATRETNVGMYITDDNGMGIRVGSTIHLEMHFQVVVRGAKVQ